MKVLITGNRGYVGAAVTKYLNKKNIDVYGIDNNFFSKKINKNQTNIDIREINENILDNIDGVVHLAGKHSYTAQKLATIAAALAVATTWVDRRLEKLDASLVVVATTRSKHI